MNCAIPRSRKNNPKLHYVNKKPLYYIMLPEKKLFPTFSPTPYHIMLTKLHYVNSFGRLMVLT